MIFGKSFEEKKAREVARTLAVRNGYGKRQKEYAFFPTPLYNGRTAWLQYVWVDRIEGVFHSNGYANYYVRHTPRYYLTETGEDK